MGPHAAPFPHEVSVRLRVGLGLWTATVTASGGRVTLPEGAPTAAGGPFGYPQPCEWLPEAELGRAGRPGAPALGGPDALGDADLLGAAGVVGRPGAAVGAPGARRELQ